MFLPWWCRVPSQEMYGQYKSTYTACALLMSVTVHPLVFNACMVRAGLQLQRQVGAEDEDGITLCMVLPQTCKAECDDTSSGVRISYNHAKRTAAWLPSAQ